MGEETSHLFCSAPCQVSMAILHVNEVLALLNILLKQLETCLDGCDMGELMNFIDTISLFLTLSGLNA